MVDTELSRKSAQAVMVHALGLGKVPTRRACKPDLLREIRRMGQLQIDTINVVARSPYLVLFSRLGAYPPEWLDELLAEGEVFEAWSHAACFLPKEDYALQHAIRHSRAADWWFPAAWVEEHRVGLDAVLARIREQGEVRSADFERKDGRRAGWWDWKFEKHALEYWFLEGELMISRRENFNRVYDLRDRVRPGWQGELAVDAVRVEPLLAERAVQALGLVQPAWVADYYRRKQAPTLSALRDLLEDGVLREVRVEGWPKPFLYHQANQEQLEKAAAGRLRCTHTTLLSPFDPLTWDRRRARELFGFDYLIECYTPAAKRLYGYFALPILRRGALVGRLDAKAIRRDKVFEVRGLFLEEGVHADEVLAGDLAGAIQRCADWHATPQVRILRCEPPAFSPLLERALRLLPPEEDGPAAP